MLCGMVGIWERIRHGASAVAAGAAAGGSRAGRDYPRGQLTNVDNATRVSHPEMERTLEEDSIAIRHLLIDPSCEWLGVTSGVLWCADIRCWSVE
jgi:hypothetical protein